MSKIKIYNGALEYQGIIDKAISAKKAERINSDYTLDFSTFLTEDVASLISGDNIAEVDSDYFDIVQYKKGQASDGSLYANIQCEHVSYRLNDPDFDLEYFTQTGTPTAILTELLLGTGFTAGTVGFTDVITYSAQEKKSRRQLLMEFVSYLGGEVEFSQFTVSILTARGSSTPKSLTAGRNIDVIDKTYNKREKDQSGNALISYTCKLIKPIGIALGDVVTLSYAKLEIDISLRVVSISTNPYNSFDMDFEIGNFIPGLQDDLYRIETGSLTKNKTYYGARIGPENGFESIRNDKMARGVFNADKFALQRGDGTGENWIDEVYFDPVTGRYKFNGLLESQTIVTQILYANQGYIAQLTVDQLETSDKVQKYLAADTSDVNYIRIYDQYMKFITASTDGTEDIQLTDRNDEPLYWTDETNTATTYTLTPYPVMVYVYDELIKLVIAFTDIDGVMVPQIVMGAGAGNPLHPDWGKGFIYKDTIGLLLKYIKSDGSELIFRLGENGIEGAGSEGVLFYTNGGSPVNVDTIPRKVGVINALLDKSAHVLGDFTGVGNASAALTITILVKQDGNTIYVYKHKIAGSGYATVSVSFMILAVSAENHAYDIYMSTDTGTWTIDANGFNFFLKSTGIAGAGVAPPEVSISQALGDISISFISTFDLITMVEDVTSAVQDPVEIDETVLSEFMNISITFPPAISLITLTEELTITLT